jgi:hypothetical protein
VLRVETVEIVPTVRARNEEAFHDGGSVPKVETVGITPTSYRAAGASLELVAASISSAPARSEPEGRERNRLREGRRSANGIGADLAQQR